MVRKASMNGPGTARQDGVDLARVASGQAGWHMKRRELIAIGGAALVSARAHAAERVIGWISPESREATAPFFAALQAGLKANMPPGGDTIRVIERYGVSGPGTAQQVAELQQQGVSLIVVQGAATPPVIQAKPSVPVVFAFSGDPVVGGIVQSLARPGGNATGMSFMSVELNPKRIDFLRTMLPACRKIALLSNARHFGEENEIAACQRTVEGAGIELSVWRSQSPADIQSIVGQALESGAQALVVLPSSSMVQQAAATCAQCLARKVPVVSGWASLARAGALLTYGPNLDAAYRRIGFYVVRVLGGAAPASLPVEQPTVFELILNRKTANALGVTIPPTLLAQADEVIE
jgi:putative ABC transport system substrate-binding protein